MNRSHESLCCSRNEECAHLPARIGLKASNIHSESSAPRAWEAAIRSTSIFMARLMTITTGKLYSKSLALEVAPMVGYRFKREKVSLLNGNLAKAIEISDKMM